MKTTHASNRWSHGTSWSCPAMPSELISAMTMDGSCRCVRMGWICPCIWTMGGRRWTRVCMTSSGSRLMEMEISIWWTKAATASGESVRGPVSSLRWRECVDSGLTETTKPPAKSMLHAPEAVVFDQHNHAYISDTGNHRVRKVDSQTGLISTVAGNGDSGYEDKNMGGCGAARFVAKDAAGQIKHGDGLTGHRGGGEFSRRLDH